MLKTLAVENYRSLGRLILPLAALNVVTGANGSGRNARLIWTSVLELARLMPSEASPAASIDVGARMVRDTPRIAEAIRELVADSDRRRMLHQEIGHVVSHGEEVLGRWAAVMLNADAYAELVDRHVELASDVAWLNSLLDHYDPAIDPRRRGEARSSVAVQLEGEIDGDRLADRVVVITQLAEELDRSTLELATRIVPAEWWQARLGTTIPAELRPAAVRKAL